MLPREAPSSLIGLSVLLASAQGCCGKELSVSDIRAPSAPLTSAAPQKSPLQAPVLGLHVDQRSTELFTPFTVKLTLRNPSDLSLFVNGRFALLGDVNFEIHGPEGRARPYISAVGAQPATPNDVTELKAGSSIWARFDLANPYLVNDPGRYTVCARYRSEVARDAAGHAAWTGTLSSECHEFERGPASAGAPSKLLAARGWLGRARELVAQGDHAAAAEAARSGLDQIGSDYRDANVVDDTGMKLSAAESRARGNPKALADARISALIERLELFQRRLGYPSLVSARAYLRAAELVLRDGDDGWALKLALFGLASLREDLRFVADRPRVPDDAIARLRDQIAAYETAHPDAKRN
jgi:hypothetical protein